MKLHMKKPRGSILLFTIVLVIPLLLMVAGVAVDVSMLYAVRSELHRSMDAAALAGAGNLGFDASVFPAARAAAQTYGALNPYLQNGPINLDLNPGNLDHPWSWYTPGRGDITLGVWNGATRTFDVPSCDITSPTCLHPNGFAYFTMINAVRCRTRQASPTYFLNLIGLTSLNTWGEAIAPSYPPMSPPPNACTFPIGVSDCPFRGSGTYGSAGCGNLITFIDANVNTSGWINLGASLGGTSNIEQTPNANTVGNEINQAAGGTGCVAPPAPGTSVGMNGGMIQSVYDLLANINPGTGQLQSGPNYFNANYRDGQTVPGSDGDSTPVYSGPGWKVYVPIVYSNTNCTPPENMNQPHTIAAYAEIVIMQVINNGWCAVNNPTPIRGYTPAPNPWTSMCPPPNGTGTRDSNLRAIFAMYKCGSWQSPPVIVPAPRAALADRLRLVQ
jgi:Putative Flp pilus-assembly TadE/G-like